MEMTLTYTQPTFSRLIGKHLTMAALGGSLLAGSWWAESYALRGEIKPVLPPYSIGCTRDAHVDKTVVAANEDHCPAAEGTPAH